MAARMMSLVMASSWIMAGSLRYQGTQVYQSERNRANQTQFSQDRPAVLNGA